MLPLILNPLLYIEINGRYFAPSKTALGSNRVRSWWGSQMLLECPGEEKNPAFARNRTPVARSSMLQHSE